MGISKIQHDIRNMTHVSADQIRLINDSSTGDVKNLQRVLVALIEMIHFINEYFKESSALREKAIHLDAMQLHMNAREVEFVCERSEICALILSYVSIYTCLLTLVELS